MRLLSILLLSGVMLFSSAFRAPLVNADQDAIKKVCLAESQAWLNVDYAAWAATHAQIPEETLTWNLPDGTYMSINTWEQLSKMMTEHMKTQAKSSDKVTHDNFTFLMDGDGAFVKYDQQITNSEGRVHKSREHRVMVRINGSWKIAAVMSFHDHKT